MEPGEVDLPAVREHRQEKRVHFFPECFRNGIAAGVAVRDCNSVWRYDLRPDGPLLKTMQQSGLFRAAGRMAGQKTRPGEMGLVFLDTVAAATDDGAFPRARWSFLVADPFGVFRVRNGQALWNGAPLNDVRLTNVPLAALRQQLSRFRLQPDVNDPAPFRGGCAGYIAYDFGRRLERLAEPVAGRLAGSSVDDMTLGFYDVVVALDHATGRATIYSSGFPEAGPARAARAQARGEAMRALLEGAAADAYSRPPAAAPAQTMRSLLPGFTASHDRAAWIDAVARVQEYIRAGDIFQANIARRFSAPLPPGFDPFAFYGVLRAENPAPFAAFADFGDVAIASSSPERFLTLRNGQVEARPIKGTAVRSADPAVDAAAGASLLASEKDRAENVMIVDLLRNDLSRVCAPHSVKVAPLCALESYANVHHLVSGVTGRLQEGRDAIDLIGAAFPGGSITGAPKLRAMDIITEIEGAARGVYCGAIGYIGFDGGMDLNIAIRTAAFHGGEATFQAGGGITLLSQPEQEFVETEDKAARLFSAFARYGSEACS